MLSKKVLENFNLASGGFLDKDFSEKYSTNKVHDYLRYQKSQLEEGAILSFDEDFVIDLDENEGDL